MLNLYTLKISEDIPGDPELGGWRPLPSSFFRNNSAIHVITLWQALQCIGFELRHRELKRAVEAIGNKLSQNNIIKGG